MIHLFKKIYLEDDNQINPRYEHLAIASKDKDHPLSKIFNQNVGKVQAFSEVIKNQYSGEIENFWIELIDKSNPRSFVVYADTPLFLKLLLSYWKSVFTNSDGLFFFQLYNFYRIDNDLKGLEPTYHSTGNNDYSSRSYPLLKFDDFMAVYDQVGESQALRHLNKGFMPIEYLVANYFFEKKENITIFLKKQVLDLAWKNWCRDVRSLRYEIAMGFHNIHFLFPDIQPEFTANFMPKDIARFSTELQWLLDREIRPENFEYIRATYPADFFPKIQSLIDKICQVQIHIKGVPTEDIDIFNQASNTEYLYKDDFEGILKKDIQRSFGSFFLKDDTIDKVNHFLLNHIYGLIKSNKNLELGQFQLR